MDKHSLIVKTKKNLFVILQKERRNREIGAAEKILDNSSYFA
jgi:hypothetical protein